MREQLTAERILETDKAFQEPEWYFRKRGYHVRVRVETVRDFIEGSTFARILDVGCGDGSISLPWLRSKSYLTLLDMSDGMLARARARIPAGLSSRVNIVKSDFMSAKLEPNSYDLIICLGVMAYVEEVPRFLEKVATLLTPRGELILEWTDSRRLVGRAVTLYHRIVSPVRPPKVTLVPHNSQEILGAIQRLGFRVSGSYRYCSPLPVVRKVLGEELNYRIIRWLHGDARWNRAAWLGEECIFHFGRTVCSRPS
jgi:ubiquinone/menaquinone biosynthesis C-methylase UbiE